MRGNIVKYSMSGFHKVLLILYVLASLFISVSSYSCEEEKNFEFMVEQKKAGGENCSWLLIRVPTNLSKKYEVGNIQLSKYDSNKKMEFATGLQFVSSDGWTGVDVCLREDSAKYYSIVVSYTVKSDGGTLSRCATQHEILNIFDHLPKSSKSTE